MARLLLVSLLIFQFWGAFAGCPYEPKCDSPIGWTANSCIGCATHRWRRSQDLTASDKKLMPVVGATPDGSPVYLCRTTIGGEMTPGKYRLDQNVCYVGYNGKETGVSQDIQVYTNPLLEEGMASLTRYYWATITDPNNLPNPYDSLHYIPIGFTANGVNIYAASATITQNGMTEKALGKIYANNLRQALIPFAGKEYAVSDFKILACYDS